MRSRLKVISLLVVQLTATLLLLSRASDAISAAGSPSSSSTSNPPFAGTRKNAEDSKTKWSSLFSIDPSKILSTLIKNGGLLIPKSAERDLALLRRVLSVERAELNLVDKFLVLHNFDINVDQQKALRIGRACVRWNSYTQPSLDIEVDLVEVNVIFTNLLLTRSNWNDLLDMGFPPQLLAELNDSSSASSSFVRINSIDLSQNLTIRVLSAPLKKKIGELTLDLDATDEMSAWIQRQSGRNLQSTGRSGITTTELAVLLQDYVGQKVRDFVTQRVSDIVTDAEAGQHELDRILTQASSSVLDYVDEARKKKAADLSELAAAKLARWGASMDKLTALPTKSMSALHRFNASELKETAKNAQALLQNVAEKLEKTVRDDGTNEDNVLFPDW